VETKFPFSVEKNPGNICIRRPPATEMWYVVRAFWCRCNRCVRCDVLSHQFCSWWNYINPGWSHQLPKMSYLVSPIQAPLCEVYARVNIFLPLRPLYTSSKAET